MNSHTVKWLPPYFIRSIVILIFIFPLAFLLPLYPSQFTVLPIRVDTFEPDGNLFYVANTGNDENPGTISEPFRTIQKGVDQARPGDTVYVRYGIYHEQVHISKSGTPDHPITISGYPDDIEEPIIDGQYDLPLGEIAGDDPRSGQTYLYNPLVLIAGNYIIFQKFEVIHSHGRGIQTYYSKEQQAHNIVIRDCRVSDIREGGIVIHDSKDVLVENCEVSKSGDYAPWVDGRDSTVSWPGGLVIIRSESITLLRNNIYNNWTEGIISMGSSNVNIIGNTVYDNFAVQIYLERTSFSTVEKNLVYHTNDPQFQRQAAPSPGLGLADELHNFSETLQRTKNNQIINNIIVGCNPNFFWWGETDATNGLIDSLIAHNTLVNATQNSGTGYSLVIHKGNHTGSEIANNIIIQDIGESADVVDDPNLDFSHNVWSKAPPASVKGEGDIVADPRLANPGAPLVPGEVDPSWYKLKSISPAINSSIKIEAVTEDFFSSLRGVLPDRGAHEYVVLPRWRQSNRH